MALALLGIALSWNHGDAPEVHWQHFFSAAQRIPGTSPDLTLREHTGTRTVLSGNSLLLCGSTGAVEAWTVSAYGLSDNFLARRGFVSASSRQLPQLLDLMLKPNPAEVPLSVTRNLISCLTHTASGKRAF